MVTRWVVELAEAVIQLAAAGVITLLVSPAILTEPAGKLRNKFSWTQEESDLFRKPARQR